MRIISLILLILLVLLGITFAILNAEVVNIHYYFGRSQMPLSLLLVLTFSLGMLIGLLVSSVFYFRAKRELFRLKSRLRTTEKEIENLRAIPLQDTQ